MHLGVDARDMVAPRPRGVGKALLSLFAHLQPLVPDWNVSFYTDRPGDLTLGPGVRTRWIDMRGDRFNAWENVRLPLASLTDRIEMLHCPSQTAPPYAPCPVVLTVHDLIPLRIDDGWSARETRRFRKAMARSVASARRVIAVSEFTRRDVIAEFAISQDKVSVVGWGVDMKNGAALCDDQAWESIRRDAGIHGPYFVAFGGDAPRKNVPGLLEAVKLFVRDVNADVQILLLGVPQHARAKFSAIACSLGIDSQVLLLDYVSDSLVATLMARAEALVYPSLYEGFGLPILEAMAMGAPVITSNVTSMPEVAANAAVLVNPHDSAAIADAMRQCYLNSALKDRLRSAGYRRAEEFSWGRCARETLDVYSSALH